MQITLYINTTHLVRIGIIFILILIEKLVAWLFHLNILIIFKIRGKHDKKLPDFRILLILLFFLDIKYT